MIIEVNKSLDEVIANINAITYSKNFHWCRSTTKQKYLEPNLSISKMYALYVQECNEKSKKKPISNMWKV